MIIPTILSIVVMLAAIIGIFRLLLLIKRVTIFEYERGLKYSKGRFTGILEPGQYWYFAYYTTITKIDLRPRIISVSGQEILSADGVTLKVSLATKYEIADPYTAINKIGSYDQAVYMELQLALREIIGKEPIDRLLKQRTNFNHTLQELCAPAVAQFGVKLLSVSIKDIMFPGELKKIFTQVVQAQKEGMAALERARSEDAALRKLANTAKLLENNPNLLYLRLIEALETSPAGYRMVLELPSITKAESSSDPLETKEPASKASASTPSKSSQRRKKS
ncbi:SPFH domain / Band 7 family, putative [Candidatus Vecturithrix granuli]|uniref:SPFH domain / Band 7 family, putative n=1 Tax=Vecturithrix granuli TaxID=1499967 RepID=A0A0S6WAW7_VECG1|nr:SPFH domain / Band 7 family, putative [Candidatus Vecturithrix granuli]